MVKENRKKSIVCMMNSFSSGKSGSDVLLIELLKRLQRYDMSVVTSELGKDLCEREGLRGRFYLTSKELTFPWWFIGMYGWRTIKALCTHEIHWDNSILYVSSDFFPDVLPVFFKKKKSNLWIQFVHHVYPPFWERKGSLIVNSLGFYLQRISFIFIKNHADVVIAVNCLLRDQLVKAGFDKKKVLVIPNGIDLEYLKKVPPSKKKYDAVFLARLKPSKGIFDLVPIWKKVCEKLPGAKLAVIGNGSSKIKKKLIKEAQAHNLERSIDFLGFMKNDRAFSLIKSSRVFIAPSHEEGFGIAIAEAMACGAPAVTWDLPVYKIIFRRYSIQVEEHNIGQFAQRIIEILQNTAKARLVSLEGKRYIQKYSWDRIINKHIKVIHAYEKK